ncbi:hypothetical protein ACFQ9X_06495 [Catenulispora yoronensis]
MLEPRLRRPHGDDHGPGAEPGGQRFPVLLGVDHDDPRGAERGGVDGPQHRLPQPRPSWRSRAVSAAPTRWSSTTRRRPNSSRARCTSKCPR